MSKHPKLLALLAALGGLAAGVTYAAGGVTGFCHDEAGHLTRVMDVSSDVNNCGGCGTACSTNHVTAACSAGTCNGVCGTGWGDCNGNKQSDGCETSLYSVSTCGACGVTCSTNHVTAACSAGVCNGLCNSGWGDCNGNKQSDGCETSLTGDSFNCGACGRVCGDGQECRGRVCGTIDKCSGVDCGVGRECDPDTGRCVRVIP